MKGLFEMASINLRSRAMEGRDRWGKGATRKQDVDEPAACWGHEVKVPFNPKQVSKQAVLLLSASIHAWNVGLWKQSSPLSQDGGCLRLTPGLLEFRMTYHIQRATQAQCLITWRHFQKAVAVSPILAPAPVLIY